MDTENGVATDERGLMVLGCEMTMRYGRLTVSFPDRMTRRELEWAQRVLALALETMRELVTLDEPAAPATRPDRSGPLEG